MYGCVVTAENMVAPIDQTKKFSKVRRKLNWGEQGSDRFYKVEKLNGRKHAVFLINLMRWG